MCARLRSALLTMSLLAVGVATAYGQSTTFGQFLGTVTDLSGAVVPGASVTAVNRDTNIARTTVTNERGDYVVDKLIPGVYDLRAELSGFKTEVAAEVRLLSSQKARVDFLLTPGAASETVSVTDHSVTLDTATAERIGDDENGWIPIALDDACEELAPPRRIWMLTPIVESREVPGPVAAPTSIAVAESERGPVAVADQARVAIAPPPPLASGPTTKKTGRKRGKKVAHDDWGLFDPDQCGFAALVAKLDEVTDNNHAEQASADTPVSLVAY